MPSSTPTSSSVSAVRAVEAVAEDQDALQARLQLRERAGELGRAEPERGLRLGPSAFVSSIRSLMTLSPSPTGVSRLTWSWTSSRSSWTRFGGEAGLGRDLVERRVAVQLLAERPARALHAAHLVGDVDGQPDRAALLGERARDRLPDPPGRVGRELEAERVVELLDRADQAEVALLDQVEQRRRRRACSCA